MKTTRFAALILAVCLSLTLMLPAGAAGNGVSWEEASQAVAALGISPWDHMDGLTQPVTRAEFVAMAIKASPGGDGAGQAAVSPYPDVPRNHWASGYVEAAVGRGLVTAFSDGTFRPDQAMKLAEGVSMVLALLGYGPEDFSGAYPSGQLAMYRRLKLDGGVTAAEAVSPLTRQDAVYLFYNLLSARTREGIPYIQSLGYSLDSSGRPDLVALINGSLEGPVVAQRGWSAALPFTPSHVYRNGSAVSLSAIQDYDVVYWNDSMGTVWAYAKKVTGVIQDIAPSSAAPASVTVAGQTYAIESSSAAYDLSDLGRYHLGDSVTLLLGRSGGVAAAADVAVSAGDKVGVVIHSERASYPDGAGGVYTAQTVTLLASDGQTYQYQAQRSYRVGTVVRATASGSEVTLRGLSSGSLSGTVNSTGTRLDRYSFAQDAEILDVSGGRGAVLYPSRLAGMTLNSSKVLYYALNPQGEIETLILSDATGDACQYGILTRMKQVDEGLYSYDYDIAGVSYSLPSIGARFQVSDGPICLTGDPASPDRLQSLTSAKTGQIAGNQFVTDSRKYTLSDSVLVYEYRNEQYFLSSLSRAAESGGTLTAWYDQEEINGGRIRVIVVK